ncbi:MAG: hypothetical protein CMJ81_24580 [Planctomycetaceae bacterium]|nr:hypothetical protein [Planctomycetaceae bacterium]MBP60733.1 hypothetical protein [Planctomycetaceae bacterium]
MTSSVQCLLQNLALAPDGKETSDWQTSMTLSNQTYPDRITFDFLGTSGFFTRGSYHKQNNRASFQDITKALQLPLGKTSRIWQ